MRLPILLVAVALLATTRRATAFEPILMKEGRSPDANIGTPCSLALSTNGSAANYRWYNVCSGYVWLYVIDGADDGAGVLFGGAEQPEVRGDNVVKRAITYWRDIAPGYGLTVDVYVNSDAEGDGCPEALLASDLNLDPSLRWNCSDFNVGVPCGTEYLIVRTHSDGGGAPIFATDGPFSEECDPNSPLRSFYYGYNGTVCTPWIGPGNDPDNFLYWLVLDAGEPCPPNAAESRSWGVRL